MALVASMLTVRGVSEPAPVTREVVSTPTETPMQALTPAPLEAVPEHLRPSASPTHATSLKVVTASPEEVVLYLDLTYAGEVGPTATVCAHAIAPEGAPLKLSCSPTGVGQGRGFYTLRTQIAGSSPPGEETTQLIGYQVWGADGRVFQQEYFQLPHTWRK